MTSANTPRRLVLASTSPFRRELLGRLGLPFEVAAPNVDERRQEGESPQQMVTRLAELKARAVADRFTDGVIVGSDQVACIGDAILGKPRTRDKAIEQLQRVSGKAVTFYTGLCVLDVPSGRSHVLCEPFRVQFRPLETETITAYLDREEPYNCAGSFKSEGLGVALFERLEGDDPNALVGLPLIRLVDLLGEVGIKVL
ncbi:MAG: nucleoside triphosphate pyrophosphatase [Pseudomonadota bacterium]